MLRESMTAIVEPWKNGSEGTRAVASRAEQWEILVDSGMAGVCVPPDAGGSGLGLVEAGCILEALGSALDDGTFLMSAVLAVHLLSRSKGNASNGLLTSIASGRLRASVLLSDQPDGAYAMKDGQVHIGGGPTVGLSDADAFLLVVRSTAEELPTLLVFPASQVGFSLEEIPIPDETRAVHRVRRSALAADAATARLVLPRDAAMTLRSVAAAALSVQMLGGAAEVLALSCQYARERVQFGGPIGRFQAIKHLLADGRVMLDGLRSLCYAALWQLGAGANDGPSTAYAAKIWAAETYGRLASDAIQVHGAMGIAAESRPHRYLKRSLIDRVVFGAPPLYLAALHEFNANL